MRRATATCRCLALVAVVTSTVVAHAGQLEKARPAIDPGPSVTTAYPYRLLGLSDRFLVTWRNTESVPLTGRMFDLSWSPLGTEFPLGVSYTYDDAPPNLLATPTGDGFVVVQTGQWQRYDSTGAPVGTPHAIAEPAGSAIDGAGHLVVLTEEQVACAPTPCTPATQILLTRYALDGTLVDSPVVVTEDFPDDDEALDALGLTVGSDGTTLVAWSKGDIVTDSFYPYEKHHFPTGWMRRYDSGGAQLGSDFVFSAPGVEGYFFRCELAADGVGRAYILSRFYPRGSSDEAVVRRFQLDGSGAIDLPLSDSVYEGSISNLTAAQDGRVAFVAWTDEYDASKIFRYGVDSTLEGTPVSAEDDLPFEKSVYDILLDAEGGIVALLDRARTLEQGSRYGDGIRLRRFCDSDDPTCDRCAGFDDAIDEDEDGIPDGCDPCVNVAAQQDSPVASTFLSFDGMTVGNAFYNPRHDNIATVEQKFTLPAGVTFATLPVVSEGLRLRVESLVGDAMLDVHVPGGDYAGSGTAGWTAKGRSTRFTDRTATPANGIRRIRIRDLGSKSPGLVSVSIKGSGGEYAARPTLLPMRTIVVLGGAGSSAGGICSEAPFVESDCSYGSYYYIIPWSRCGRS